VAAVVVVAHFLTTLSPMSVISGQGNQCQCRSPHTGHSLVPSHCRRGTATGPGMLSAFARQASPHRKQNRPSMDGCPQLRQGAIRSPCHARTLLLKKT